MTSLREVVNAASYHLGLVRWLFIHIPKNAGTAIRKSPQLRGRLIGAERHFHVSGAYTKALEARMAERGEHHGREHARLRDIHPRVRARLQPVAIVRNPWARTVSRFRFAEMVMQKGRQPANYAAHSFEAFLEERHVYGAEPYYWHRAVRGWYPQRDYVVDETGALAADVLRQEHLAADAAAYFGIDTPPRPRNVTTGSTDYRRFYSPQTIQIVADWYASDIETFGFDFDGPATRNVVGADQ